MKRLTQKIAFKRLGIEQITNAFVQAIREDNTS